MESPHGDPTTPGVAPARVCVYAPAWADEVHRAGQEDREDRKTGRTARHTEQGGQLPTLPTPPTLPTSHARLPCPVSRLSRVCHIVNRSATRALCKTAFCQAILLFLDLPKRYILIHNDLRAN